MITILYSNKILRRNGEIINLPILANIDPIVFSSNTFQKNMIELDIKFLTLQLEIFKKMRASGKNIKNLIVYYEPVWMPEIGLLGIDLFESDFIIKNIPEELKKLARLKKLKIILSTVSEPFSWSGFDKKTNYGDKAIILNTHKIARELKIPGSQIIILSGDLNAEKKWLAYVNNRKILDPIIVKTFIAWGGCYKKYQMKHRYNRGNKSENIKLAEEFNLSFVQPSERIIKKTFTTLNRHLREHRVLLIELLYRYKLLNDGFVSCPQKIGADCFEKIAKNIYQNYRDKSEIIDIDFYKRSLIVTEKILPLELDEKFSDLNSPLYDSYSLIRTLKYFNDSFCSIITETAFDGFNAIFLSEKVFKPIILNHPFLVIGQRYILKTLQQFGFRTFSPLIDESYDNLEHWIDRTHSVLKEIKRLSFLSRQAQLNMLISLKEILDHNYDWYQYGFQKKRKNMLKEIISEIEEKS